ncbi:MAG: 50S ribosomal protein L10 [Candidatus Aenigmarchaeota archaeon]|nr:50S ribosomal protein L10 [Candidatus Aenigmarchaeota archaeon]
MVSKKKLQVVKEMKEEMKKYPVIGLLDMHKMPARQLHEIRNSLRGDVVIRMVKKRLIKLILKESKLNGAEKIEDYIQGEPAFLLSGINPFKLARTLEKNKSKAAAKPGDIAPKEMIIPAGPTPLAAGPAIGELQKIGLQATVQDGKIAVRVDKVVAKEGEEITEDVASVLGKLGIEPMEIGLNLVCTWENGTIYEKDILFVPLEQYEEDIKTSVSNAFNLAVNINYPTAETIGLLLSKAHSESLSLAKEANIITPETVGNVLAKAKAEAEALEKKTNAQK